MPQIWRVATNILNKQTQAADRGSHPPWSMTGGGEGLRKPLAVKYQHIKCWTGHGIWPFENHYGDRIKEEMWRVWVRQKMCATFWFQACTGGRIILKRESTIQLVDETRQNTTILEDKISTSISR